MLSQADINHLQRACLIRASPRSRAGGLLWFLSGLGFAFFLAKAAKFFPTWKDLNFQNSQEPYLSVPKKLFAWYLISTSFLFPSLRHVLLFLLLVTHMILISYNFRETVKSIKPINHSRQVASTCTTTSTSPNPKSLTAGN